MVTRQELYDRIQTSSKDEVILEEMIRLGFWPAKGSVAGDPAEEIRRRGELERLLVSLTTEKVRLHNPEAIKKAMREQRMAESKRKRQENKERRLREAQERAAAWQQRKGREILYLGDGVSGGLSGVEGDDARLTAAGLPVLHRAEQLAAAMQITLGELRFLSYARRVSSVSHYKRFQIPKKSGGMRQISAPMARLKRAQNWILHNILDKIPDHDAGRCNSTAETGMSPRANAFSRRGRRPARRSRTSSVADSTPAWRMSPNSLASATRAMPTT
jgi:hypothetical protein